MRYWITILAIAALGTVLFVASLRRWDWGFASPAVVPAVSPSSVPHPFSPSTTTVPGSTFRGPTSPPHVIGPSGPPPRD